MIITLVLKFGVILVGAHVLTQGIKRRRAAAGVRRDPVVDTLLYVLAMAGAVFLATLVAGGVVRTSGGASWLGDALDWMVAASIVVAFVCGPILGWRLVGEHEGQERD